MTTKTLIKYYITKETDEYLLDIYFSYSGYFFNLTERRFGKWPGIPDVKHTYSSDVRINRWCNYKAFN